MTASQRQRRRKILSVIFTSNIKFCSVHFVHVLKGNYELIFQSTCVFQIRGRRHLVFASDKQLELLQQSKTWYIDGTFKLCRQPFTQLLTLNAFVKNDDHVKQVPLVFVIMSGQKRRDYRAVLDAVTSILPRPPRVTKVMLDFEKAVWSALRQTLPNVQLKGCSFHWTQALWRKVGSYLTLLLVKSIR